MRLGAVRASLILAAVVICATGAALVWLWHGQRGEPECFSGVVRYCIAAQQQSGRVVLPPETDYWGAPTRLDEAGLPYKQGRDGRQYRNASSIAFAMWPRDGRTFAESCAQYEPRAVSLSALAYFRRTAVALRDGAVTWRYNYDTHANDALITGEWASAFAQAAIVERLLIHHCKTGDASALEMARRAGRAFAIPVTEGGVRSQDDAFVWFQEVPLPDRHNPFIVNAHLYAIQTLMLLDRSLPEEGFRALALRGLKSFRASLDAIDNGHWTRYDLRPRYTPVTFLLETAGVVRSVQLRAGVDEARLSFLGDARGRKGNGFDRSAALVREGVGASARQGAFELWFSVRHGREFAPAILSAPVELSVMMAEPGQDVRIGALGARPGAIEFFELPRSGMVRAEHRFAVSLADMGWGHVAAEYVPFHALLLASIATSLDDRDLFLRAIRWHQFSRRNDGAGHATGLRRNWRWAEDSRIADAVWQRFKGVRPELIAEDDLRALVNGLP